jgi:hypothetical protein
MKQKTIHISFGKQDEDLYNELVRESAQTYVPLSTLIRVYLRDGMNLPKKLDGTLK